MLTIKILGSGCANCKKLEAVAREAATASHIEAEFDTFLQDKSIGEDFVVALQGVGSLFGFLKVKEVVDKLAPKVKGRLLVFFPGSYEDNNYRLLDGYDGWNYLAVPITADKEF